MPTLDSLPADRRAIIELVLRQAKPYSEISDLLGLPEARVQAYARESLAELAPRSARRVDERWRDRVADYLLGQLGDADAAAAKTYIASSEPARTWSLSVIDSLGDLYADGTEPEIPEAGGAPASAAPAATTSPRRRAPARPARSAGGLSPAAQAIVLRRRIAMAVAATVVIGLLAFFIGPGFKGKPASPTAAANTTTAASDAPVLPIGALELKPEAGETGQGVATFLTQDGKPGILVQAKMDPNADGQAYEVWLYNSQDDAVSIGAALTDKKGNYVGTGPLPTNFGTYKYLDISREDINDDVSHSGDSVLRGSMDDVQPVDPSTAAAGAGGTPTAPSPSPAPAP